MTPRERNLLLIVLSLGSLVLVFGGLAAVMSLLNDLDAKDQLIARLAGEVSASETRLLVLGRDQRKLEEWKTISLPPDPATASLRYRAFLLELARKYRLTVRPINEAGGLRTSPGRNALIVPLTFTLQSEGTLSQIVAFLREFYSVNLPHQVRSLSLTPLGGGPDGRIGMNLTVEALSLPNIPHRDHLLPTPDLRLVALEIVTGLKHGPIGLALGPLTFTSVGLHGGNKLAGSVTPERDYMRLITKNVFTGLAPPPVPIVPPKPDQETLKYVKLTDTNANFIRREATLYNRLTNKHIRLRNEGGFDSFEVHDAHENVLLKGRVKYIERRDVVFVVDGKNYLVHLGESLHQALETPMTDQQLRAFNENATADAKNP